MARWLSIFFGVGLLRPMPGSWGSAAAVVLGVLLHHLGHFPLLALATGAIIPVGFWAIRVHTANMEYPDRPEIVIDEVAGQWLALCFPSAAFWWAGLPADVFPYPAWVASFLLFRIFDIRKPWLVGRADRDGGVKGVMVDDLWAGIFAGIITLVAAALAHGLLM